MYNLDNSPAPAESPTSPGPVLAARCRFSSSAACARSGADAIDGGVSRSGTRARGVSRSAGVCGLHAPSAIWRCWRALECFQTLRQSVHCIDQWQLRLSEAVIFSTHMTLNFLQFRLRADSSSTLMLNVLLVSRDRRIELFQVRGDGS